VRRLDPKSIGQHLDVLYRAAWALCGSREDAEDLVQETYARVLARPRVIREDERAYLMRALRNTFYSRLRTASRRPQQVATLDDVEPIDPRAGLRPERAAEIGEVMEAISELPEDFRLALVAVDVIGLSYGEAATALDTREATITTRLYRARQRIAKQFAETPPGGEGGASGEGSSPKRSLSVKENR
jgi:RNA polymerase sigma-70 factor (ECF subfamily)